MPLVSPHSGIYLITASKFISGMSPVVGYEKALEAPLPKNCLLVNICKHDLTQHPVLGKVIREFPSIVHLNDKLEIIELIEGSADCIVRLNTIRNANGMADSKPARKSGREASNSMISVDGGIDGVARGLAPTDDTGSGDTSRMDHLMAALRNPDSISSDMLDGKSIEQYSTDRESSLQDALNSDSTDLSDCPIYDGAELDTDEEYAMHDNAPLTIDGAPMQLRR